MVGRVQLLVHLAARVAANARVVELDATRPVNPNIVKAARLAVRVDEGAAGDSRRPRLVGVGAVHGLVRGHEACVAPQVEDVLLLEQGVVIANCKGSVHLVENRAHPIEDEVHFASPNFGALRSRGGVEVHIDEPNGPAAREAELDALRGGQVLVVYVRAQRDGAPLQHLELWRDNGGHAPDWGVEQVVRPKDVNAGPVVRPVAHSLQEVWEAGHDEADERQLQQRVLELDGQVDDGPEYLAKHFGGADGS
mmetsp:Transcript_12739/g.40672  ORF Transcript_12739/g.40672 Transcript_12739/m.40672 type:complete len:251 (+) Transcript_12739:303-1055(+)